MLCFPANIFTTPALDVSHKFVIFIEKKHSRCCFCQGYFSYKVINGEIFIIDEVTFVLGYLWNILEGGI